MNKAVKWESKLMFHWDWKKSKQNIKALDDKMIYKNDDDNV